MSGGLMEGGVVGTTQTVAGEVTANAGTNLNTSALATQTTLAALLAAVNDYPTVGTPTTLAISGGSAATAAALTAGKYLLYTEIECCWIQGAAPTATWQTDAPLPAGTLVPVTLTANKLAAQTAGGSGVLYIIPVS